MKNVSHNPQESCRDTRQRNASRSLMAWSPEAHFGNQDGHEQNRLTSQTVKMLCGRQQKGRYTINIQSERRTIDKRGCALTSLLFYTSHQGALTVSAFLPLLIFRRGGCIFDLEPEKGDGRTRKGRKHSGWWHLSCLIWKGGEESCPRKMGEKPC